MKPQAPDAFEIFEPIPSWKRYKSLFLNGKGYSVTRALQYELLSQINFRGKTLDFGGGQKAKYRDIISCETYESVNIDPAMEPTWITREAEPMPCPKNHYDSVISLNTLEHIFDARGALAEIYKVLKPGGVFVGSVPFLYPIHAHPDDFFRPTKSWWIRALSEAGFKKLSITPLLWGPYSTGMLCSGSPGPFKRLTFHVALWADLIYARLKFGRKSHFNEETGHEMQNHALGYFIKAEK